MMQLHRFNKGFLFVVLLLYSSFVFSTDWVLAAIKFDSEIIDSSVKNEKTAYSAILESIKVELPKLIMSYVSKGVERKITDNEYYQRELHKLQIEQQKNFESYRANILARDKIVVEYSNRKEIETKILEAEGTINKTKEKIDLNIQAQKDLLENIFTKKNVEISNEVISVYKNDVNELYSKNQVTLEEKKTMTQEQILQKEKEYEKAVIADKINGLISGIVVLYDNYIQVTSTFTVYPSTIHSSVITEIGTFTDIDYIAQSIANQMIEDILLSKPVNINFTITTDSSEHEPRLFIDKAVYRGNNVHVQLPKSTYQIRIEADNCKTVLFNYEFNKNVIYNIDVKMEQIEIIPLFLSVVPNQTGQFFLNGLPQGDTPIEITVSDKSFIGQFISSDNINTFFLLDINNLTNITIPVLNESTASIIDKSRKRLYFSYGLLLCTLPYFFYTQGEFDIIKQAYELEFATVPEYNEKVLAANTATIIVGVTAANMVFQLVRYLLDANVVYPNTIDSNTDANKIAKKSFYKEKPKESNKFMTWLNKLFYPEPKEDEGAEESDSAKESTDQVPEDNNQKEDTSNQTNTENNEHNTEELSTPDNSDNSTESSALKESKESAN